MSFRGTDIEMAEPVRFYADELARGFARRHYHKITTKFN